LSATDRRVDQRETRHQARGQFGAVVTEELSAIGRAAEAVGLSLRTIRYYDEIGLVTPSSRSPGGFRLYSPEDVDRLLLIKRMKPLGYSLEEMADLLSTVDGLQAPGPSAEGARARLETYATTVQERIAQLQTQLDYAREFHSRLLDKIGAEPEEAGRAEA